MRKLIINNLEKILYILAIIAILYSFVAALVAGRDQMMIAEEGFYGIIAFLFTFIFTLAVDLAITLSGVIALYLLVDIRSLLIKQRT